jgi:hypothetical protein
VFDGRLLPCGIADVLPAGDFLDDQQADLVAAVEEYFAIRMVTCAH